MTRRQALLTLSAATAAAAAPAEPPEVPARIVERNDLGVDNYLRAQITDPASPWLGSVPDDYLLHPAGSAAGLLETLTASLLYPRSKHFQQNVLVDRMRLAAAFLERSQTAEGNIDLLSTNFNSPPDTGFVVHKCGDGGRDRQTIFAR